VCGECGVCVNLWGGGGGNSHFRLPVFDQSIFKSVGFGHFTAGGNSINFRQLHLLIAVGPRPPYVHSMLLTT